VNYRRLQITVRALIIPVAALSPPHRLLSQLTSTG